MEIMRRYANFARYAPEREDSYSGFKLGITMMKIIIHNRLNRPDKGQIHDEQSEEVLELRKTKTLGNSRIEIVNDRVRKSDLDEARR